MAIPAGSNPLLFARETIPTDPGREEAYATAVTLRDLMAVFTAGSLVIQGGMNLSGEENSPIAIAKAAYLMADALIAARERLV